MNWHDDKNIICNVNNDISVKIPSHLYVLVNTQKCIMQLLIISKKNNFLLEFLAAYYNAESKLLMYFIVNITFVNYLDSLTETLEFPILLNWTTHE